MFPKNNNIAIQEETIPPLDAIDQRKRRRYTLLTLGGMIVAAILVSGIAFMQGLLLRQVINTSVALLMLMSFIVLCKSDKPLRWPTVVTVLGVHVIVSSGFLTNGGIGFYGTSMLPVVPMISALLLGRRAAMVSIIYVLLLSATSVGLEVYGVHPVNITAPEDRPMLAFVLTVVSITVAYLVFNSLMLSSKVAEEEVRSYARRLETEMHARCKAEAKAQEAAAANNNFLSTISHELRTPLNSIIGFTKVMASVEQSARGKDCTDHITRSSEELLKKINDLLAFTEIVFDKISNHPAPIIVDDLFTALKHGLARRIVDSNNRVEFDYERIAREVVIIDGEKVKKVLDNIIENALKYTTDGVIYVTG